MAGDTWQQLSTIPAGSPISHWSILKGRLSSRFTVKDLTESAIYVETQPGTMRRISRVDFENVAKLWPEYKGRSLSRHALSELTVNSTYILSLLHVLDPDT